MQHVSQDKKKVLERCTMFLNEDTIQRQMSVLKDSLLSWMRHEERFWEDETRLCIEPSFNVQSLSLKTSFGDET